MNLEDAQAMFDPDPGWLNTASYGLPPRPSWEALQEALAQWRGGRVSWGPWAESVDRSRRAFARLVGVDTSDVSVGAQVSQMLAPLAAAVPDGATILVPDEEFTSNLFPWMVHHHRGVQVRTVPAADLADAVDERTYLVAFSVVQSSSGAVADVDAIVAAAAAVGALTVADGSQACGWLPVDAARFDALVCAAYKWLLSPRGTGFLVTTPALRERIVPLQAGWSAGTDPQETYYGPPLRLASDARRLDISPAWFNWVATAPALELLTDVGVEVVHDYDVALANRFLSALGSPGTDSAIVSVDAPGARERLDAAGIRAAVRHGRLRASFHLYTTTEDVDRAAEALTSR